ncbi:MAG: shikimate kinase [Candidatus Bathyarchaeota archaeon]|nr:MAG: shikimate kinase [Candidatus Bathyarchaeota archaeon]
MDKSNIVLIGMPGSGKSTIGKFLSKIMHLGYLDCDNYIEQKEDSTLQQIIDEKGVEEFKRIEEAKIMELDLKNHVIAPGGSIIYYPNAIEHLKQTSFFVFLNVSFNEIKSRLKNAATRGIVGLNTKTLYQLYNERHPLYLKYADIVIDCSGKSKNEIVSRIYLKVNSMR